MTRGADAARTRSAGWRKQAERQRRNRRLGFIALSVTVVAVTALVVSLVFVERAGQKADTKNVNATASASLVNNLATVPAATFDAVGSVGFNKTVAGLTKVSGSPVTVDGKPTLIYVGGEFCPYCAAERWVLATALDRFGRFDGLQTTRSAADDGDFATLTFLHASYSSSYVAFDGREIFDRARNNLETLTGSAKAAYDKYDSNGTIPFVSVNNAYTGSAQYAPEELGKLTAGEIASQIHAGTSALARSVIAAANILSAAICQQTGDKPSGVCTSSGVMSAVKDFSAGSSGGSGSSP